MARPTVTQQRTSEPGVQKRIRTYEDGRIEVRYRVQLRDGGGVLRNEGTYTTLKEARAVVLEKRDAAGKGTLQPRALGNVTIADLSKQYLAAPTRRGARRERTRRDYERLSKTHILPRFGNRKVNTITEADCADWMNDLKSGKGRKKPLSPATVRKTYGLFSWMLGYAVRKRMIPVNPALEIALPRGDEDGCEAVKQVALTAEQVQRLAAAASAHHPSYGLLVDFLAVTGLRMSEAAGLNIGDVTFTQAGGGIVRVERTYDPRFGTGKPKSVKGKRDVPLGPKFAHRLAQYIDTHPTPDNPTAPLWLARMRGPVSDGAVRPLDPTKRLDGTQWPRRVFAPAVKTAGLVAPTGYRITPHALRHTAATMAIEAGVPLFEVSRMLGHSGVAMIESVYGHLLRDHAAATAARVEAYAATQRLGGDNVVRMRPTG